MEELLYKYLILHRKVSIPGVGVFTLKRKPAQLKYLEKVIVAPALNIAFTQMNEKADESLYKFISTERNIEVGDATTRFNDYAYDIKTKLRQDKRVAIEGLGVLTENSFMEYQLEPVNVLNGFFPDVKATRVERDETEQPAVTFTNEPKVEPVLAEAQADEQVPKPQQKDDWWIFAIILAILAIATIAYYYMQNGALH